MEADLITAPGDGLAPAILLTLNAPLRPQYLFNVPEGFSRYTLEHKIRPGLGLRAVFCSDLSLATGLSGLCMRLRGEGHGQVEVMGPPGTIPFVSSLKNFVHWKHPAVLVSEIREQQQDECCYSDEHVEVYPLWNSSKSGIVDWKLPEWLQTMKDELVSNTTTNEEKKKKKKNENESTSNDNTSSGTSTDDSSTDDSSSSNNSSSSSDDDDKNSECSTSSSSSSDDDKKGMKSSFAAKKYDELDTIFSTGNTAAASRGQALGLLRPSSAISHPSSIAALVGGGGGGDAEHQFQYREEHGRMYKSCPTTQGISLFTREQQKSSNYDQSSSSSSSVLFGFLIFVKASQQVLLVVSCQGKKQCDQLEKHPAVCALIKIPKHR